VGARGQEWILDSSPLEEALGKENLFSISGLLFIFGLKNNIPLFH
jgi:hypothetical protein